MLPTYKALFRLFIQTKTTPNPLFLKFVPTSKLVMGTGDPIDFDTPSKAAQYSPLARKIFRIDGITQVFYGKDHISIGKTEETNWNEVKPMIFDLIQEHYQSQEPLIVDRSNEFDPGIKEGDSDIVKQIKDLLTSRVRPFVQDDGGDVQFISFDQNSGLLRLKMMGSCAGCPSTEQTLKNGILKMMNYYIGEVKDVIGE